MTVALVRGPALGCAGRPSRFKWRRLTERSSLGSPCSAQSPTVPSSTMNLVTSRLGVSGIPLDVQSLVKRSVSRRWRKSALNGPTYL